MAQGYQQLQSSNGSDTVTEATPLLLPRTTDSLLPLPSTNANNTTTIVTACPDTNGNDTVDSTNNNHHHHHPKSANDHETTTSSTAVTAGTNGRRRQFLHRKLRRTMDSSSNNNNGKGGDMDTSDGSRESTTSSIHSHLQSFRDVSLRLIQYVAHHSGTIFFVNVPVNSRSPFYSKL
jgi:hypothetical protein